MRLGIILPHDPRKEVEGRDIYPSLLFYLGTYLKLIDALEPDEVDVIVFGELEDADSSDNDFSYLKHKVTRVIKAKQVISENIRYDVMATSIVVGYPEGRYKAIDDLSIYCNSFIYFDGDTEPKMTARTTMFDMITKLNLSNLKNKIKAVSVTEASKKVFGSWDRLLGREVEIFIPYILHPFYLEDKVNFRGPRKYDISMMKSAGRNRRMLVRLNKSNSIDHVKGPYKSMSLRTIKNLLSDSKSLLGTIAVNVHSGCYRSSSKIMEALHSGCLPTVIKVNTEDLLPCTYPYLDFMPEELKILTNPEEVDIIDTDKYIKFLENIEDLTRWELVNTLYRHVYNYHSPTHWTLEFKTIKEKLNG